jgi:hypothetical protein
MNAPDRVMGVEPLITTKFTKPEWGPAGQWQVTFSRRNVVQHARGAGRVMDIHEIKGWARKQCLEHGHDAAEITWF